jgi:hypothetical protein
VNHLLNRVMASYDWTLPLLVGAPLIHISPSAAPQ